MHEDFFGDAAAEQNRDARQKVLFVVGVVIFFRKLHRHAQGSAARDDRHLMHGIGLGHEFGYERMTGFVIGGVALFVLGHHHGLTFRAHHDLVFGKLKVVHIDHTAVTACGKKRSFVHEVCEIGA